MPPLNLHETTALAGPPPTFLDDAGGGRRALDRSTMLVTLMAALASFGTYACMYAFRKPFAAGTFAGAVTLGFLPALPLKTLYLIAQVIGYATSKMLGVKLIAEAGPAVRARAILGCIAVAELSLVLFAVLPAPYNALAMVLNGLPLGLVWGLVVGFIEGRRTTDVLGSILAASFIVASGMAKSVGLALLGQGVPEVWMPAAAGALFLAPLAR